MYTAFYQLRQEPFHVTPDPEFLFPSPAHKEALAAIVYGIQQRKGFVAITGEVGVGKTTILRSYLDLADRKNLKLIYVYNSNLTFDELLTTLFQELGIADRPATTFMAVTRLHEELIEIYRRHATVVLIVDEAQNMPIETLESLRMLSNLETVAEKLIQIILIGQPEFEEMLREHRLRQLRQRIAIHARIAPLTTEDSLAYLTHRLNKVAVGSKPVFTKQALRLIAESAQGIPRNLNIIADNTLITGFGYQIRPVGAKIVREVLADRHFDTPARPRHLPWIMTALTGAAAVAAYLAFGPVLHPDNASLDKMQVTGTGDEPTGRVGSLLAQLRELAERPGESGKGETDRNPPPVSIVRTELSGAADRVQPVPKRAEGPAETRAGESIRPTQPVAIGDPQPRVVAPAPGPVVVDPAPDPSLGGSPVLAAQSDVPVPTAQQRAETPPPIPVIAPQRPVTAALPEASRPPRGESTSAARNEPLLRTVKSGDSLWTMAEDVYGYVNPNILRRVQDANPWLRNINVLSPGQDILFPQLPEPGLDRAAETAFGGGRARVIGRN